jgi:chemotaxis protein methyltransferase CheR
MAFTYFFRDVQTLEMIRDVALPHLRSSQRIRIWDAGCAMGPEPYTLAIILRESMSYMLFRNLEITATDLDGSNLFEEIIREGIYPREQVERIPADLLQKHFEQIPEMDSYQISEEMRKAVHFQKHDLLTLKPPGKGFGLILCKNVLLHFQQSERIQVMRMYHDCLIDGGYLAMEQTQKLPEELDELFELAVPNAQVYRKRVTP